MREVVERRQEGVESCRETRELEQVLVNIHEPSSSVGEGEK